MLHLYVPELKASVRWFDIPGALPARVYLHGLGSAAADFFPTAAHPLLTGRRTILVDLLGFGFSDHPEAFDYSVEGHAWVVERLLDELALSASEVVAHSMGGAIAVSLAAARPDLITRLVVAEPCLSGAGRVGQWIAGLPEESYVHRAHGLFVARLRRSAAPGDQHALPAFEVASPLAVHRSAASLSRDSRPSLLGEFAKLEAPRAYLVGANSPADPGADAARASGSVVVVVPGAGHMMMNDAPQAFAECLSKTLEAP
jgi:pimeloyl-ACP methyl ester carboxylesterase